jgi:hypothetical protein
MRCIGSSGIDIGQFSLGRLLSTAACQDDAGAPMGSAAPGILDEQRVTFRTEVHRPI